MASLEELEDFLSGYLDRLHIHRARVTKRQKVKELKSQVIVARVKKLAKELELDFMTDTDTVKVMLFLKMPGDQTVQISIPYKEFEEIIPHLRSTIAALRDLYQTGIRFHTATPHRRRSGQWISYKDD